MPTLVNVATNNSCNNSLSINASLHEEEVCETAATSDLAWMAEELPLVRNNGHQIHRKKRSHQEDHLLGKENNAWPHELPNQLESNPSNILASPLQQQAQESSISCTFDEDELLISVQAKGQNRKLVATPTSHTLRHPSSNTSSMRSSQNQQLQQSTPLFTPASLPHQRCRTRDIVGTMEHTYQSQYETYVQTLLTESRNEHGTNLQMYTEMNEADKVCERQFVASLLQRLGILIKNEEHGIDSEQNNNIADNVHHTIRTEMVNDFPEEISFAIDGSSTEEIDEASLPLLSPPEVQRDIEQEQRNIFALSSTHSENSSTHSIEKPRVERHLHYDSPTTCPSTSNSNNIDCHNKRIASTSGKRGGDTSRLRLVRESVDDPASPLRRSISKLSLRNDPDSPPFFAASQSPISQHLTHSPVLDFDNNASLCSSQSFCAPPDISFGHEDNGQEFDLKCANNDNSSSSHDDITCSTNRVDINHTRNDTLVESQSSTSFHSTSRKNVHWVDVHLVKGQAYVPAALPCWQHRRPNCQLTQSFPDPFSLYRGKLQRRLIRLYNWMIDKLEKMTVDEDGEENHNPERAVSSCAILSVPENQMIIDLVVKLLLDYPVVDLTSMPTARVNSDGVLQGQTLIVVRSKSDLESWSRSFRENTAWTVLDHASMPARERKSRTMAPWMAAFHIVLTTFDTLKSPDVTNTLNSQGHVVQKKDVDQQGWYTTSSSQSQSGFQTYNKPMSVLHDISWYRVVFCDILGRKSFLAKAGTARVVAAAALNATSRYDYIHCHRAPLLLNLTLVLFSVVFLLSSDMDDNIDSNKKTNVDNVTVCQMLTQSDKSACQSLSSVLHFTNNDGKATNLRQNCVDFLDKSVI